MVSSATPRRTVLRRGTTRRRATDEKIGTKHDLIVTRVKRTLEALQRLGCNAQILVSWSDGDGTSGHSAGVGNWYARMGLAQSWIDRERAIDLKEIDQ